MTEAGILSDPLDQRDRGLAGHDSRTVHPDIQIHQNTDILTAWGKRDCFLEVPNCLRMIGHRTEPDTREFSGEYGQRERAWTHGG